MAIVLALTAAMAYGSADFVGGVAARHVRPVVVALSAQLAGFVLLLAALPLLGAPVPASGDLLLGAVAGLFSGTGLALLLKALARGPMSVVAPTTALCASLVPILAGLGAGERPGSLALIGIGATVLAVVLITREHAPGTVVAASARSVLPLAVIGGTTFGVFFALLDRTADSAGLWPLVAARSTSIPLLAVLALAARRAEGPGERRPAPIVALSGVLDMAANIAYLVALRHGMLAVVAAITGLYPAATVLLARRHLDEQLRRPQLAGLGAGVAAAVLIAVG
jgi:drug/metabolite transporter (DMT)-like permease